MTSAAAAGRRGTVQLDGAPLAYDVTGSGPAVVLLHSGMADRRMWDPLVDPLAAEHTVVRYDLRGFGRSSDGPGRYAHHDQLWALLDHVGIDEAALVGCSMGAYVALSAAIVVPERTRRLVLISPVVDGVAPTGAVRAAWEREADALDAGDVAEAVETNLRTWFDGPRREPTDVDPQRRRWIGQLQADVLAHVQAGEEVSLEPPAGQRLDEVRVPTTIVTGSLDQRWVLDCADRLAAGIADVRLHAVDGTAHLPPVEAPDRVAELLLRLLATESEPDAGTG